MKQAVVFLAGIFFLASCSNNGGQTGVQNDGMKVGDTNGAAADTLQTTNQSGTDTAQGEHRVDLSSRDTFQKESKQ